MKKFALLLLVLLLAAPALGLTVTVPLDAATTNQTKTIDTSTYKEAIVTVSGASPDGTLTVYVESVKGERVAVATYATPSTAKTWIGPTGYRLTLALTGMSTGSVTVSVGLR